MRTELRFLVAIALTIGVLVGTNLLFPPAPPEGGEEADTLAAGADTLVAETPGAIPPDTGARDVPPGVDAPEADTAPAVPDRADADAPIRPGAAEEPAPRAPEGEPVVVEGPLYRFTFSTRGARLRSAELLRFRSFTREGPVELLRPTEEGALGLRLLLGEDTLDLSEVEFEASPEGGLTLEEGGEPGTLDFAWSHPTAPLTVTLRYTFRPGSYLVDVEGRVEGLERAVLLTGLGSGLAFNEAAPEEEARSMAYVVNHAREGIRAEELAEAAEDLREEAGALGGPPTRLMDGPLEWVAFKSKYFVFAILAMDGEGAALGGVLIRPEPGDETGVRLLAARPLGADGTFSYRVFAGPQEFARLSALGNDLEDVNPYGWRFFRPVIRPLVGIVMWVLTSLHENLNLAYGWVLVLFGVMMRLLLFPLNQKAMRAQLRNMAVQPLLKEIQEKHKNDPERLQKEMMRLYKEHGFNPLAGCLPMLLPWPILITLFFVFQNTIELRGVPFLWLPDLSAPDPLHLLPIFLAVSMFGLQWVSLRSMDEPNPQMKMMMWMMPGIMLFIFWNLASGLNLYYATANIATLPQQYWIAQERKKAKARGPITASREKKETP